MESRPDLFRLVKRQSAPFFLSGHFPFQTVQDLIKRPDVFTITIVREPTNQLLSHLKWVKYVGSPEYPDPEGVASPILVLAKQLYEIPLADTAKVARLIDCPSGRRLFDNLHIRYLTHGGMDRVNNQHLQSAVNNVKAFDFMFALADIDDALKVLRQHIPNLAKLKTVNVAPINESSDLADGTLLRFLEKRTSYDRTFYEIARSYSLENHLGLDRS